VTSFCRQGQEDCTNFKFPVIGSRQPYGMCGLSWPIDRTENGTTTVSTRCHDTSLTLVDFGALSKMAYLNDTTLNISLVEYFPGWQLVHFEEYQPSDGSLTRFFHIRRNHTSIFAVRGTDSAIETLQDISIWTPVVFAQFASWLGPSFIDIPKYVHMITVFNKAGDDRYGFQDLIDYVNGTLQNSTDSQPTYYITGHSLGGGVAKVIGGLLNITAITFSAPGLVATAGTLDPAPAVSGVRHESVTVTPENDLVPKVDEQAGSALVIDCPFSNPLSCHSISATWCELLAACGDGGGRGIARGYNQSCAICSPSGQVTDPAVRPLCARKDRDDSID